MVNDLSFKTETFPCFKHSVQDVQVQVYLLQELQCKDFLAAMKQNHPMYLGKVSGDELMHLDQEVTNANCMICGGFRLSAQRCYDRSATKMPHVHPCPRLYLASNHALHCAITTSALPPPLLL